MFWILLLAFLVLIGFAFDWIRFQVTEERFIMTLELSRMAPLTRRVRQLAAGLSTRGRESREH